MRLDRAKLKTLAILDEDDALVAVAKPPGMAVHGGAGEAGRTVIELLEAAAGAPLHLVHRLDKATGGLLLVAKSKDDAKALSSDWERAEKQYLAVALGEYRGPERISKPLPDEDGVSRPASTRLAVLGPLSALAPVATLLLASIETGRTHQIRRHLAMVGAPVLLDDKHGDFRANKAWVQALKAAGAKAPHKADLMLHAWRLVVEHPRTRERREWLAPLPPRWWELLAAAGLPEGGAATLRAREARS